MNGTATGATTQTAVDILCIGDEDWDDMWRRNQFLLSGLMRLGVARRILFVERPCDLSSGLRTRSILRENSEARAKLTYAVRGPRRSSALPGLWVLTPLKFLPSRLPLLRWINQRLEFAQVRFVMHRIGMRRPLFWSQNPQAAHWLGRLKPPVVYDATDDWSLANGSPRTVAHVTRGQEVLACQADLVLACSQALYDKWKPLNEHTYFLPNGVDTTHFGHVGQVDAPPELAELTGPILGYTGTLHDERIDVPLVCELATVRSDCQIVFVGPDYLSTESRFRLRRLPNVHLLGSRPYSDLPAYMSAFDVCILPHVISPFTESLNPIKMFEYLATGLPVVSTPVAGIRDIPELVYLANGEKEFAAKVEIALAESDEELRSRRRAFAEKNSWDRRVAMVADLLASMSGRDSQFMQALETHVAAEG